MNVLLYINIIQDFLARVINKHLKKLASFPFKGANSSCPIYNENSMGLSSDDEIRNQFLVEFDPFPKMEKFNYNPFSAMLDGNPDEQIEGFMFLDFLDCLDD